MNDVTREDTELAKVLEYECSTAERLRQALTGEKVVCVRCGAIYHGTHLVARIDTAYHLWTRKGYVKKECVSCQSQRKA